MARASGTSVFMIPQKKIRQVHGENEEILAPSLNQDNIINTKDHDNVTKIEKKEKKDSVEKSNDTNNNLPNKSVGYLHGDDITMINVDLDDSQTSIGMGEATHQIVEESTTEASIEDDSSGPSENSNLSHEGAHLKKPSAFSTSLEDGMQALDDLAAGKDHLFVYVHGRYGISGEGAVVKKFLETRYENVIVLLSEANSGNTILGTNVATSDGIRDGGGRLVTEIRNFCKVHPALKYLSFVGTGIGGLYARYACGLLYENSWGPESYIDISVKPAFYVSLATPHAGVLPNYGESYWQRVYMRGWHAVCGRELLLEKDWMIRDKRKMEQRTSVLEDMALNERYIEGMKLFSMRILYGAAKDDISEPHMAPFGSALLVNHDTPDIAFNCKNSVAVNKGQGQIPFILHDKSEDFKPVGPENPLPYWNDSFRKERIANIQASLQALSWRRIVVDLPASEIARAQGLGVAALQHCCMHVLGGSEKCHGSLVPRWE
eukprot:UC4_evm1s1189